VVVESSLGGVLEFGDFGEGLLEFTEDCWKCPGVVL
jgi:hypothetical protein